MPSPCQMLQKRLTIILVILVLTGTEVSGECNGNSNECDPPIVLGDGVPIFNPDQVCYNRSDSVVISCSGHLYGVSELTDCSAVDGSWEEYEPPTCEESNCTVPDPPGNVLVTGSGYLYDLVTYTCINGEFLDGSNVAFCTGNGTWDPPATPTCPGNCTVPSIENSIVIINDTPLYQGTSIKIVCDEGFTLTGPSFVTCYDETWSPDVGECLANCPAPFINNSNYAEAQNSTNHGDYIIVECDAGYTSGYGSDVSEPMTCGTGTWDASVRCYANCPDISAPTNGSVHGEESPFYHGHDLFFNCSAEFTLVGEERLNCSDGTWSADPPVCKANCLAPLINNSNFNDSNEANPINHGSNITVICFDGYTFGYGSNFNGTMTCDDGTFDYNDVECLESCDTPTIANSNLAHNESSPLIPHNGRVVVDCDEGYTSGYGVDQNETLLCQTGSWNATVYCYANCPNITAPEGGSMYLNTDPFYHNESVYFNCSVNYLFVGQKSFYCSDGEWTGQVPDCKASCESPVIDNSNFAEDTDEYTTHGKSVGVDCDPDYTSGTGAEVTETLYCDDGSWNSTVYCYGNCPNVTVPEDGIVYTMFPHYHNDVLNFSCDANFTLVGNETVMCNNGSWEDSFPECMANCLDPGTPINGSQVNASYTHGGQVRFVCDPGYDILGAAIVTCNDGNWSSPIPTCEESSLVDQIKLRCSHERFVVQIPLELLGVLTSEEVVLEGNRSCTGSIYGDLMFVNSSLEACGTDLEETDEYDVFTNRVIDNPTDVISRGPQIDIPIKCTYNRKETVDIVYHLQNYTIRRSLAEDGQYTFMFAVYTDDKFSDLVSSSPFYVALDAEVYFGISLLMSGDSLRVVAQTCWATPTHEATDNTRWPLINDSCPVDESVDLAFYEDSTRSLFSLSSFRFIDKAAVVYIHCDVIVCGEESSCIFPWNDCSTGPRRRKRRAVYTKQRPVKRLTSGPIIWTDSQNDVFNLDEIRDPIGLSQHTKFIYIAIIATLAAVSIVLFAGLTIVTVKLIFQGKNANKA